jgi:outer membrane protein OmpA-like peptidoglycan-associated protein
MKRISVGAGAVVLLIAALAIAFGSSPAPPRRQVIWIGEKTTRAPGVIPEGLHDRVHELSARYAGTVTVFAVGSQARRVGSFDLEVLQGGDREDDAAVRDSVLDRRLQDMASRFRKADVGGGGYSLYAALQVAAAQARAANSPVEVWLSTTLLAGSYPPLELSRLLATDPQPAARQVLAGAVGKLDLSNVELHSVMLTPVGPGQPPLTPVTEQWRVSFLTQLASGLNAAVEPVLQDTSNEPAWPASSAVSLIPSLPDPTPTGRQRPDPPPVNRLRIDNVSFIPDKAELVNPAVAARTVRGIMKAYRSARGHAVLAVTGYCAAFGDRQSARQLSKQRAETIGGVLRAAGADPADIRVMGLGYDQRADLNADPTDSRQRVVMIQLIQRR